MGCIPCANICVKNTVFTDYFILKMSTLIYLCLAYHWSVYLINLNFFYLKIDV